MHFAIFSFVFWKISSVSWWKHFPRYWLFARGIHRSPVNSPHKGQWRRALMFALIYTWTNGLSNRSRHWWFETPSCFLWCRCNDAGLNTVYPKKYAHGFCFAVLCCGYTLTDFPIPNRLTSLALWQSNDCPSASKANLMNMDKYFMWIHYEQLHNHNKAKHNKTVCIFLGTYCRSSATEPPCGGVLWSWISSDRPCKDQATAAVIAQIVQSEWSLVGCKIQYSGKWVIYAWLYWQMWKLFVKRVDWPMSEIIGGRYWQKW